MALVKKTSVLSWSVRAALLGFALSANAQDDTIDSTAVEAAAESNSPAAAEAPVEEIVVTGSRLKRDTFSSIAPLQVITTEFSKEVGLIDAADILQGSTASTGQQIDLTFQGFVLDNGPAASTVDLRGLGAQRNLILVNGRRVSPSGVEGAPAAPNLNLLPRSLVERYDIVLDGASSVYGSDAIAGVVNAILRKDFDGFELELFTNQPEQSGGADTTVSAAWGFNTDRGVFGIGGEYVETTKAALGDREWTGDCTSNVEIDQNGNIRTEDQYWGSIGYPSYGNCAFQSVAARTFIPAIDMGSIYYTPGYSNGGWGNFSESGDPYTGFGADGNGDGVGDVDLYQYDLNGKPASLDADLFPKTTRYNIMAYGEYTFEGEANITPYFEANYSYFESESKSGEGQLFPTVPANNPFNLCNPNQPDGVDCGLAAGAYLDNPSIAAGIANVFGLTPAQFRDFGIVNLYPGALGPVSTIPIVSVRGDRNRVETEQTQMRAVFGVRGDMPFLNIGTLDDWSFDAYVSYSLSEGESRRFGVREDRLEYALGYYSSTSTPCENDLGAPLREDAAAGCVPVNMYAPSLYPVGQVVGDFGSQAERDYLFDTRDFDTEYEQTIVSAYATGDLFELPAGGVALGLGVEFRKDEIKSIPDAVAAEGLFWGFFSDKGARGSRDVSEFFVEAEIPILANLPLARELNVNLSARFTDDEYYGDNTTESIKLGWRPADSLLIRGTWGTAFRAPNLRELFLAGSTGFLNVGDPCYIPEEALDNLTGEYNPANDKRDQLVLDNCRATGVDPTLANNGGFNTFSVEVQQGGSLELDPEESESWTVGFAYEQDFSNKFDLSFGMTFSEIEITNTVIEPSTGFIIGDCYFDEAGTGASAFCDRITRDFSDPTNPEIVFMDLGFINRDKETYRGIDYNLFFKDQINIGVPIDMSLNITATKLVERSTRFTNGDGSVDEEGYKGEWGFPEWRAQMALRFEWDRWAFTWETRFTDDVNQDPDSVDDFDSIAGLSDTCLGPPDDVLCRDYARAEDYFRHSTSLFYRADTWSLGAGIRNVFDEKPPVVDGSEVLSYSNTPIGYGYDLQGRVFFLDASYRFGGGS
jgi:iron complex outermembrane receptor protein